MGKRSMIRALGKTKTLRPGQPLTKHDFYLPLTDVLLDLVEKDLHSPEARLPAQLGCSLAHDFINLATAAGQLLWLVDVAPVRTGTPDSLSISMLAESYLMQLRAACDVIAVIVHTYCIDEKLKGQVPDESLNDLMKWIGKESRKASSRVPDKLKFIAEHRSWFCEVRGIRDKLVHNRYDININTDEVAPSYATMSTGDIHLHFLRNPGQPLPKRLNPLPLLPFLRRATQGALHLAARIAEVIAGEKGLTPSKTHVINGVYIPALSHLLSYEEPSREASEDQRRRREIKARHLWYAGDYLNAVKLGHPDGFWLPFAVRMEELFGVPPDHVGEPIHPRFRDGEALFNWHFHFYKNDQRHVVLLRDGLYYNQEGLEQSRLDFETFKQDHEITNVIVISDVTRAPREIPQDELFEGLILDTDPIRAAERAFAALTESELNQEKSPSA
jgi:hypothetical protein